MTTIYCTFERIDVNVVEMAVEKLDTWKVCFGRTIWPRATTPWFPSTTNFLSMIFEMSFMILYLRKPLGATEPIATKLS